MKESLTKLLLVSTSVVLTLATLEIGLRFLGPPPASAPVVPDPVLDHVHLRDFTFKAYSPDDQFQPFTIYWDSRGLVADPEKPLTNDPSRFPREVALVGDSFVESCQVAYAASFAGRLNAQAAPDVHFSNWGVSSYSPMIYVPLWRNQIQATHPVHVFLLLYENDVNDDAVYATKAEFGPDGFPQKITGSPEPPLSALLRRSSLFRTLRFAFIKIRAGINAKNDPRVANAGQYQEVSPDISPLTSRMILGLKKDVEETGAQFTILAVPSRRADILGDPSDGPRPFISRVAAWCRENGVDYLDLDEPFLKTRKIIGPGKLFFNKDIHFTAAGHEIVADVIQKSHPEYFSAGVAYPDVSPGGPK